MSVPKPVTGPVIPVVGERGRIGVDDAVERRTAQDCGYSSAARRATVGRGWSQFWGTGSDSSRATTGERGSIGQERPVGPARSGTGRTGHPHARPPGVRQATTRPSSPDHPGAGLRPGCPAGGTGAGARSLEQAGRPRAPAGQSRRRRPVSPRRQLRSAPRRSEHQGDRAALRASEARPGHLGLGHRRPERAEDAEVDPTAVEVQPPGSRPRSTTSRRRSTGRLRSSGLWRTDRRLAPTPGTARGHPRASVAARRRQVLYRAGRTRRSRRCSTPADAVRGSHGVVDGGLDVSPLRREARPRACRRANAPPPGARCGLV